MKHFNFEWRPGNSRNAYTTSYTHFRVPVVHMGPDGDKVVTYKTVRRAHGRRPAAGLQAGPDYGPYWEGD